MPQRKNHVVRTVTLGSGLFEHRGARVGDRATGGGRIGATRTPSSLRQAACLNWRARMRRKRFLRPYFYVFRVVRVKRLGRGNRTAPIRVCSRNRQQNLIVAPKHETLLPANQSRRSPFRGRIPKGDPPRRRVRVLSPRSLGRSSRSEYVPEVGMR